MNCDSMVSMRANFLKKVNTKNLFFLLAAVAVFAVSCKRNKHEVDTGDVKVGGVKVIRFEQDLFAAGPGKSSVDIYMLKAKYPGFFDTYMKDIMANFDQPDDTAAEQKLREFVAHKSIRELYEETQKLYADFSTYEEELSASLTYFKFHFPEQKLPGFVTYISEFGPSNVIVDSLIGIGVDRYLGEDYKYYPSLFPNFIIRKMRSEYIVPNSMYALGNGIFPENMQDKRFLSKIVYQGKMLYYLDAVLPKTPDSLKIGLTANQLQWCSENEAVIWKHLVQSNLLYSTDPVKYRAYIVDAPFTSAPNVPEGASPMLGIWVGWQIVKKYMDENPESSLRELMLHPDPQEMLTKSKYKPVD